MKTKIVLLFCLPLLGILFVLAAAGCGKASGSAESEELLRYLRKGDMTAVRDLIAKDDRVKTSVEGQSLLHTAAENGLAELAERELGQGADPNGRNAEGETPLHYAARHGYPTIVRLLLEAGADVNAAGDDGKTPLHAVSGIYGGKKVEARLLIQGGADVNRPDKSGSSPLFRACGWHEEEIVGLLLENGAAVDQGNDDGQTPLFYCTGTGKEEVARSLLAAGADVTVRDKNGDTVLHRCAYYGGLACFKLFQPYFDTIDIPNAQGRTPLHLACREDEAEMIGYLLSQGADRTRRDNQGQTAAAVAAKSSKPAIRSLF